MITTLELLKKAKEVSYNAPLSTDIKNKALKAMAESLIGSVNEILEANALDVESAKGTVSDVMSFMNVTGNTGSLPSHVKGKRKLFLPPCRFATYLALADAA